MFSIYKNYILTPRFIFFTIGSFLLCGLSSNKELKFFSSNIDVSLWDSILYNFNLEKSLEVVSISDIKVISIYIIILYLVISFISQYLNDIKYLSILRIGSVKKYITNLIFAIYLMIFIYFLMGYIILIVTNLNLGFTGELSVRPFLSNSSSYFSYILNLFIMNNLIMMLFSNIVVITALALKSFKVGYITTLGLLILGTMGISEYLPGSHIFFYKIIDGFGSIKYEYYLIYGACMIIAFILIKVIISKNKDFLLYDYEV